MSNNDSLTQGDGKKGRKVNRIKKYSRGKIESVMDKIGFGG